MSLQTRLAALTAAVGADIKSLSNRATALETGRVDQDPDLVNLQHGVTKGGTVVFLTSNSIRVTAGKGWILQASGLLRPVSWAQTDITGIPAASVAQRVDQLVVDSTGTVSRLAGGEGAATNLDLRARAANVPVGSLRLHDLIVFTNGVQTAADNTRLRDRRPWAKGARATILDTGGNHDAPTWVAGAANYVGGLRRRIEVSPGSVVKVEISGLGNHNPSANGQIVMARVIVDDSFTTDGYDWRVTSQFNAVAYYYPMNGVWEFEGLPAGSHVFQFAFGLAGTGGAQTATLYAIGTHVLRMDIFEDIRPSNNNGLI